MVLRGFGFLGKIHYLLTLCQQATIEIARTTTTIIIRTTNQFLFNLKTHINSLEIVEDSKICSLVLDLFLLLLLLLRFYYDFDFIFKQMEQKAQNLDIVMYVCVCVWEKREIGFSTIITLR